MIQRHIFFLLSLAALLFSGPAAYEAKAAFPTSPMQELIYQASFGRADDIRLLLKQGEKPDTRNAENVPIISLAAGRRDAEGLNVVRALKEGGANINLADSNGQTALFFAARKGNVEMTRLLLELGSEYDKIDRHGATARTLAFSQGYNDVVAAIDKFILERNEQILAQYEAYYNAMQQSHKMITEQQKNEEKIVDKQREMLMEKRKLEEQRRLVSEAARQQAEQEARLSQARQQEALQVKAAEEQKAATAVATAAAAAAATAADAEAAKKKVEEEAKKKEEDEKRKKEEEELAKKRAPERLRDLVYQLSFNFCSRQYWHYVNDVQLETEFSPKELADKVAESEKQVIDLTKTLSTDFEVDDDYIKKISDPSQNWLLEQLDAMYSNRYRKEKGVGTEADMKQRCERIAASFLLQPKTGQ